MKQIASIVLGMTLGLGVLVGGKWYAYVTNKDEPYDEIGIELNSRMPAAINAWGCKRLQASFGNIVPPYGCQSASDGRIWRNG